MSGRNRVASSALLFAACLLLCASGAASAGDYSIAYAVEVDGDLETGKLEGCEFNKYCGKRLQNSGLLLVIFLHQGAAPKIWISVWGGPECCALGDDLGNLHVAGSLILDTRPVRRFVMYDRPRRRDIEIFPRPRKF